MINGVDDMYENLRDKDGARPPAVGKPQPSNIKRLATKSCDEAMVMKGVTLGAGDHDNCNHDKWDLQYYQAECDRGEGGETYSETSK